MIAGLGNPEKKYDGTRHNAGFAALDRLAEELGVSVTERKFSGMIGTATVGTEKVILAKPLTYMNLSGRCVREAAAYYRIPAEHIIILYDDINFPCGKLRVRGQGSAGGHNGIKSILAELGTDAFPRVRIGVGGVQEDGDLISHVLGHFSKQDAEIMERAYAAAADAALCLLQHGTEEAMNRFNGMDLSARG